MDFHLKRDSKLPYVVITTGLTFIVAGLVFFMISAGLPDLTWMVLGGLCLALGTLVFALGVSCWFSIIKTRTGGTGWQTKHKEETEAFPVGTSDDSNIV